MRTDPGSHVGDSDYSKCQPGNILPPNPHLASEHPVLIALNKAARQAYEFGSMHVSIGSEKDHLTTRVAYKLNLRGPAVGVQTTCSTSLVAVCRPDIEAAALSIGLERGALAGDGLARTEHQ